MDYFTTEQRLASLVSSRVNGTLVHWRLIDSPVDEEHYIVLWRKLKQMGPASCTEFGVHHAMLGVSGKVEGMSDLMSGDYFFDFDNAVKRFQKR